jgi:hypothetical protein
MRKYFTPGLAMLLKHITSAFPAFFGGGPELTPEQQARLGQMERDYERMFGRPSKPAQDSLKKPVTKTRATGHSSCVATNNL